MCASEGFFFGLKCASEVNINITEQLRSNSHMTDEPIFSKQPFH